MRKPQIPKKIFSLVRGLSGKLIDCTKRKYKCKVARWFRPDKDGDTPCFTCEHLNAREGEFNCTNTKCERHQKK